MHRCLVSLFIAAALSFSAQASVITGTSSNVVEAAIPASLKKDVVQNNTSIYAFREQQNVLLTSILLVNFTSTGTYHPAVTNEAPTSEISAGTRLDSYIFHFDIFYTGSTLRALGTATFDNEILGIIGTHSTLVSTDSWLGNPGTLYETTTPTFGGRGLEGTDFSLAAARDWITISADRKTVTLDLGAGDWFDDIRVLVASGAPVAQVPIPGTLFLALIGLPALLFSRRRAA